MMPWLLEMMPDTRNLVPLKQNSRGPSLVTQHPSHTVLSTITMIQVLSTSVQRKPAHIEWGKLSNLDVVSCWTINNCSFGDLQVQQINFCSPTYIDVEYFAVFRFYYRSVGECRCKL